MLGPRGGALIDCLSSHIRNVVPFTAERMLAGRQTDSRESEREREREQRQHEKEEE